MKKKERDRNVFDGVGGEEVKLDFTTPEKEGSIERLLGKKRKKRKREGDT